MKKLLVSMSVLFVVFICASSGAPPAVSKTLTVADLVPMSGTAAAWGITADRGLRIMVDEINSRGGLKVGKEIYTIQLVTMDHRYVPGEALAAAKKVAGEGIKFVFVLGGGVMPAIQPVFGENKIICMGSIGAGVTLTNAKFPFTFRSVPSSEMLYELFLPRFVKMWGPLKVGFLYNNDDQARADLKAARRAITERNLPIEEVAEFVERDAIDFAPVVTRLMAKGVNLILDELAPAQGATFVKQAWDLGYKGRMGMVRAAFNLETLLQAAGKEALEGFISGTHNWPPGHYPSAKFEKFHSKYLSVYKEEVGGYATNHHAGMEFLATTLEKAGTTDTERVVKVMYDLETETVFGPTSMVGRSLGYGIKTQMSYGIPLCEVRDGRLKVIDTLRYKD